MGRSIPVQIGDTLFGSKKAAKDHFKAMLGRYDIGDRVSEDDAKQLRELLKRHGEYGTKKGVGVAHFEVLGADYGSRCFHVVRIDGSFEDFSYPYCVDQR
ncbi:DUF3223 domain-containing protein [Luteibacter pinisoli]|uniref:DUF3223 domain-containing protein n=1 Tax=Luteibacter pinisoli TaxID=2589080 RepID=A0A4Y5Z5G9_9GAMM|nr:DCL family protein [Luteibacter pinisoli]QDE40374.1 DUF3223 domain-containing protein [Luteibacter pinisoli]